MVVKDEKIDVIDALIVVYNSFISPKIDDYNSSVYYENPNYIFEAIRQKDVVTHNLSLAYETKPMKQWHRRFWTNRPMKFLLTSDILLSLPEKGIRIGGYFCKQK